MLSKKQYDAAQEQLVRQFISAIEALHPDDIGEQLKALRAYAKRHDDAIHTQAFFDYTKRNMARIAARFGAAPLPPHPNQP